MISQCHHHNSDYESKLQKYITDVIIVLIDAKVSYEILRKFPSYPSHCSYEEDNGEAS